MRSRCNNPNGQSYARYGGRGIKVCSRWDSKEAFFEDMGTRPSDLHTLDRINNDGDYRPENCRWATRRVQGNNKSNNLKITAFGREMTCPQWSRLWGIHPATIRDRLMVQGWRPEDAVSAPKNSRYRNPGRRKSKAEQVRVSELRATGLSPYKISKITGTPITTVKRWVKEGVRA